MSIVIPKVCWVGFKSMLEKSADKGEKKDIS